MPLFDGIQRLLDQGGLVLISIMVISTIMWTFIIERYLYLYVIHPRQLKHHVDEWSQRTDQTSWIARSLREGLIGDISINLQKNLLLIQTLVTVLPLLGLLGTVTGMISTFEVMMVFGTGNARGMSSGISQALITTAAGLVTSLSGLYFSSQLQAQAQIEKNKITDLLV